MCTVTYLPTGNDSFILTSNRDESGVRPTKRPQLDHHHEGTLLYPKDELAGGTWICLSSENRMLCLLNGAFEKHERKLPYRKSRGLIALEYFHYENILDFKKQYDLENIEPFTLVVFEHGKLEEFRWDGKKMYLASLNEKEPHIWSSATLYAKENIEQRKGWFKAWLKDRTQYRYEDIVELHKFGGDGDTSNDFVMNRFNIVQTVSITGIIKDENHAKMIYNDLINNHITETRIEFETSRSLEEN